MPKVLSIAIFVLVLCMGNSFARERSERSIAPYLRLQLPLTTWQLPSSSSIAIPGGSSTDSTSNFYQILGGVALGADFLNKFGAEFSFGGTGIYKFGAINLKGILRYYITKLPGQFYALLGGAYYESEESQQYYQLKVSGPAILYGVGVRVGLGSWFAITAQVYGNTHFYNSSGGSNTGDGVKNFATIEFLGLEFLF